MKEENQEARRLAEQAVRIDPYPDAWVALGFTYWEDIFGGWTQSREESIERALECANNALSADKDNPEALALLAQTVHFKNEYDRMVELMERAVSLAPNHAQNTALLSMALFYVGRFEEALERIKRAMQLSPIYPNWFLSMLGPCYHMLRQQELAISTLREGVNRDPAALPRLWLISSLVETGSLEEAKNFAKDVLRIEPLFSARQWDDINFKQAANKDRIVGNLLKAGLSE